MMKLLLGRSEKTCADSLCHAGRTPLSYAAGGASDRFEEVGRLLVQQHKRSISMQKITSGTPLSWAAATRNQEVVGVLLQWGADHELADRAGRKPFHRAAEAGDDITVSRLMTMTANVDQKHFTGRTPLTLAAGRGHGRVVRALLGSAHEIEVDY